MELQDLKAHPAHKVCLERMVSWDNLVREETLVPLAPRAPLDPRVPQDPKECKDERDPLDSLDKLVPQVEAFQMEIFAVFVKLFLKITSLNLLRI